MDVSGIGAMTALAAGAVSFLSPCVLPLVPGYVAYIAGGTVRRRSPRGAVADRALALGFSGWFVLGFSTVFVLMGAGATALGRLVLSYQYELNIAGGAVVIVFGLFVLGVFRPLSLMRDWRFHPTVKEGRAASAYALGLAFAFGWTPCIGPILGAILTVSAARATVADGIMLLSLYSAGLGIPFMLAAVFTDSLVARLGAIGRAGRFLHASAGLAMMLMGVAMITGRLTDFSYWLLETFPVLGTIG